MPSNGQPSPWRFAGVGLELAGVVAVLALIGHGLDRWWGSHPWGVLGGSMLGIVGGLYNLVKQVIREGDDGSKK